MSINKITALEQGNPLNSTGAELAESVNNLIDTVGVSLSEKNVVAVVSGDNLYLGYKISNTEDLFWHFATRGVNSTYVANKAYKFNNTSPLPSVDHDFTSPAVYIGNVDTDWVGPYIVKKTTQSTVNNFVGGHHDSTGGTNPAGVPTSRSTGRELLIDGLVVNDDGIYRCNKVAVNTSNFIKSSSNDDDAEILRQDVYNTFDSNGLQLRVVTTALDNIRMDRFYGLQCYAKEGFNEVRFLGDNTVSGSLLPTEAGTPTDLTTEVRAVNHHLTDGNVFTSFVLNGDLGDFRFKGAANPYASRTNFKTYFNLVYSFQTINAGESFEVVGGYAVSPASVKTGSNPQAKSIVYLPTPFGARIYADFYGVTGKREQRITLPTFRGLANANYTADLGSSMDTFIGSYIYAISEGSVTPNALVYGDYISTK